MKKSSTIKSIKNYKLKIKNYGLFFIFSFFIFHFSFFIASAKPYHTITVDGNLSDWSDDEVLIDDGFDSDWTGGNEIEKIYITWDKNNLYVGIKGQSNNTGLLVYFDFKDGGYTDLSQIDTWNRQVFFNRGIDYFYGSWSGSDGNFYEVQSSTHAYDTSISKKHSSQGGWELSIPFNTIYKLGVGKIPAASGVSVFASIATGDMGSLNNINFGYLGGDCAPDNSITGISVSTVTVFSTSVFDSDNDGVPDDFYSSVKLKISDIDITPSPFSPDNNGFNDTTSVSFSVSKPAQIKIDVYNLSGQHIKNIADQFVQDISQKIIKNWDGEDKDGKIVPAGIHIFNIRAETSDERVRKNKAVAVIK